MFSRNAYNMFPPHGSPSSHPRTSASDFFLHHHDILSGHHFLYNQDVAAGLNGDPSAMAAASPCTAKASKKDRHSKINTAQGPRDRRVRLSIGVARKFFDLQEILGFDKPSKTLDWLLTKSETAINDVEQMREKASTDAAAANSSECEVDSAEAFQNNGTDSKQKFKGAAKDSSSNLAKESRAKARARARERTREKMCIKKQLNETRNVNDFQFMNNQLEFRKISGSSNINVGVGFHHQNYEAANEDLIEESIVIKRKVKQYPSNSIMGFQQNLIISSSNYGIPTPYNNNAAAAAAASDNWDNICAILDQHKFINSTSNN